MLRDFVIARVTCRRDVRRGPVWAQAPLDLKTARLVDLTHPFDAGTLYWPTSPSAFELTTLAVGMTPGGYFYSSYKLCTPEHGGTHLDAPVHFSKTGMSTADLPLRQLIAPAVVIDVTRQAAADAAYRVTRGRCRGLRDGARADRAGHDRAGTHRLEPLLARPQAVSGGRHAGRRVEAEVSRVRRGRRALPGGPATGGDARHRHRVDRLRAVDRLSVRTASARRPTSPISKTSPRSTSCRRPAPRSSRCR